MKPLIEKLYNLQRAAEELENYLVEHGDVIAIYIPEEIAVRQYDMKINSCLTLLAIQQWACEAANRLSEAETRDED